MQATKLLGVTLYTCGVRFKPLVNPAEPTVPMMTVGVRPKTVGNVLVKRIAELDTDTPFVMVTVQAYMVEPATSVQVPPAPIPFALLVFAVMVGVPVALMVTA